MSAGSVDLLLKSHQPRRRRPVAYFHALRKGTDLLAEVLGELDHAREAATVAEAVKDCDGKWRILKSSFYFCEFQ
jgi:hypothetical protein